MHLTSKPLVIFSMGVGMFFIGFVLGSLSCKDCQCAELVKEPCIPSTPITIQSNNFQIHRPQDHVEFEEDLQIIPIDNHASVIEFYLLRDEGHPPILIEELVDDEMHETLSPPVVFDIDSSRVNEPREVSVLLLQGVQQKVFIEELAGEDSVDSSFEASVSEPDDDEESIFSNLQLVAQGAIIEEMKNEELLQVMRGPTVLDYVEEEEHVPEALDSENFELPSEVENLIPGSPLILDEQNTDKIKLGRYYLSPLLLANLMLEVIASDNYGDMPFDPENITIEIKRNSNSIENVSMSTEYFSKPDIFIQVCAILEISQLKCSEGEDVVKLLNRFAIPREAHLKLWQKHLELQADDSQPTGNFQVITERHAEDYARMLRACDTGLKFEAGQFLGKGNRSSVHAGILKYSDGRTQWVAHKRVAHQHFQKVHNELMVSRLLHGNDNIVGFVAAQMSGLYEVDLYMERLEGIDGERLLTYLRESGVSLPYSIFGAILRNLLQGLQHMHSLGITHADIKFANMVFTIQGGVKIIDFDTALMGPEDIPIGCTPAFRAPEQMAKEFGNVGPKTDIWLVGMMVVRALTGRLLRRSLTREEVYSFVDDALTDMFQHGDTIRDFVKQAIYVEPERRSDANELLQHDFVRIEAASDEKMAEWLIPLCKKLK